MAIRDFTKLIYNGDQYKILLKLYDTINKTSYIFPFTSKEIELDLNFKWEDLPEGQANASNITKRKMLNTVLGSSGSKTLKKKGVVRRFTSNVGEVLETANSLFNNESFSKNLGRALGVAITKGNKKVFAGTDFKKFSYESDFYPKDETSYKIIIDNLEEFKSKLTPSQYPSNMLDLAKRLAGKGSGDAAVYLEGMFKLLEEGKKAVGGDNASEIIGLNAWVMSIPPSFTGKIYYFENSELIYREIPTSVITDIGYEIETEDGLYYNGYPRKIKINIDLVEIMPFKRSTELIFNGGLI